LELDGFNEILGVLLIEIPELFSLTKPQYLPILVKQALEDANYPIPEKFNQVIMRKDGLVIDQYDEKFKETLIEQLVEISLLNVQKLLSQL